MLTLLEEELMRRLCETAGLGLVRYTSSVIAATSGAVAIGDLSVAAGVSSTHLAQRFKELIGVTPKRLARTYRFAAIRDQPRRTDRLGRPSPGAS
jgi:AraC-like DNA-binding protein